MDVDVVRRYYTVQPPPIMKLGIEHQRLIRLITFSKDHGQFPMVWYSCWHVSLMHVVIVPPTPVHTFIYVVSTCFCWLYLASPDREMASPHTDGFTLLVLASAISFWHHPHFPSQLPPPCRFSKLGYNVIHIATPHHITTVTLHHITTVTLHHITITLHHITTHTISHHHNHTTPNVPFEKEVI